MAGGSSPRLPSSDDAARLTRTTRRSSSTATMPSLAPSRIAARSACSPARVSRSWAARKAIASSWRTSASSRIRSGGSEAPSGGRSAMSPTVRDPSPASPSSRRSSSVTPCQPLAADPGVRVGGRREVIGDARTPSRIRRRVRLRRAQAQVVRLRRGEPQRAGDRVAHPHQLADHARRHHAELAAEREELAQLVLREDRVRLALGVLEDPATLGRGDGRRLAGCAVIGRRSGSIARTSRKHEVAPGSWWPRDRSPSRSARPRRAISGRVARMPVCAAAAARPSAVAMSSPSRAAAPTASAAGRSAS